MMWTLRFGVYGHGTERWNVFGRKRQENTNPDQFHTNQHLRYDEIAKRQ